MTHKQYRHSSSDIFGHIWTGRWSNSSVRKRGVEGLTRAVWLLFGDTCACLTQWWTDCDKFAKLLRGETWMNRPRMSRLPLALTPGLPTWLLEHIYGYHRTWRSRGRSCVTSVQAPKPYTKRPRGESGADETFVSIRKHTMAVYLSTSRGYNSPTPPALNLLPASLQIELLLNQSK